MKHPNVIFLIIDSLRFDRTGFGGHQPSPTPSLDYWVAKGLNLRNTFSTGCPTEFAYPGLTTSTLPLDCGGYAQGISRRPKALAEVFRDAGYHTMRMVHDSFESDGAYERGYEELLHYYDVRRLHECSMVEVNHFRRLHRSGVQPLEEGVRDLVERLRYKFREYRAFSETLQAEKTAGLLEDSLLLQGYDYAQLGEIISREQSYFEADPSAYATRIIVAESVEPLGFLTEFTQAARGGPGLNRVDARGRWLFMLSAWVMTLSAAFGRLNALGLKRQLHYLKTPHRKRVKFPSGGYFIQKLCQWVDRDHQDRPFFAWAHTVDVHEQNFWSYDLAGGAQRIREEFRSHCELMKRIRKRSDFTGNPVYDLSVHYSDLQVARLFSFLRAGGHLDNTIVVITGDHGHNNAYWPIRPRYHVAVEFYDELYHVPAAFVGGPVAAREVDDLTSSLDIGPTLLGLAGLRAPAEFRGRDLSRTDAPPCTEVGAEHMGPGLCDLALKPLRVAIRSRTGKVVYEVSPAEAPEEGRIVHAYDLISDPTESTNLAARAPGAEALRLLDIARRRVREIRRSAGVPEGAA